MPTNRRPKPERRHSGDPDFERHLAASAAGAVALVVAAGTVAYDRERHLPRLIPVAPADIADTRPDARRSIVARLARALRDERNRGRSGHWTYDLNRHIGLRQAYLAERAALGESAPPTTANKRRPGQGK